MRRGSAAQHQHATGTRERILKAAIQRFSRQSYEETGLRDIASDAGVDVAYVHRSFGSKERLFAEALRARIGAEHVLPEASPTLAADLAKQVVGRDMVRARCRVAALDIVVRSLSSPKAAAILRDYILDDFIFPLSARLREPAVRRAALIAAFLAGVGILRNVLEIAPLRDVSGGELEDLITNTIAEILGSNADTRQT